jgi:hypothetical protein
LEAAQRAGAVQPGAGDLNPVDPRFPFLTPSYFCPDLRTDTNALPRP